MSLTVLFTFFIRRKNTFRLLKPSLTGSLTKGIFAAGFPTLIAELSISIVIIVFNSIIFRLKGNIGVAAYGVIANISIVVLAVYAGIAQGIQPILCRNYGGGRADNVRVILRYALILMAIISAAVYTSVLIGAAQIVSIFNNAGNVLLQQAATAGLRLYFAGIIFAGYNIILSIYFTSTENELPAFYISILRGFLVIIPMVYLLSAIGGITGVWLAFPAAELIVAVIACVFKISKQRCQLQ
jgi:Na+-driven multidrug efflux pump